MALQQCVIPFSPSHSFVLLPLLFIQISPHSCSACIFRIPATTILRSGRVRPCSITCSAVACEGPQAVTPASLTQFLRSSLTGWTVHWTSSAEGRWWNELAQTLLLREKAGHPNFCRVPAHLKLLMGWLDHTRRLFLFCFSAWYCSTGQVRTSVLAYPEL